MHADIFVTVGMLEQLKAMKIKIVSELPCTGTLLQLLLLLLLQPNAREENAAELLILMLPTVWRYPPFGTTS